MSTGRLFHACLYGVGRPSVVCLSSVTFVGLFTHRVELFGNIFAASNNTGTPAFCVKILLEIRRCSR